MKYIFEIDGVESTRYKYNIWTAVEYDDGTVGKDSRTFATDDPQEFVETCPNTSTLNSRP